MLNENTLFGINNKIDIAVARIKEFELIALQNNPAGYYVCISGGKDSSVIQELCLMAGVKCEFVHNHTSVDHPLTVNFVRQEKQRLEALGIGFRVEYPRWKDGRQKTMWNMIITNGLPLRNQRWCCRELKEFGGKGRYCITGVRWAESSQRSKSRATHEILGNNKDKNIILNNDNDMRRRMSEACLTQQKIVLNPIIDWTDEDVWEFIKSKNLPVNPLYGMGYKRVGCVGCPMSGNRRKEMLPKYKSAYFRAARRHIEYRRDRGLPEKDAFVTPEKYFDWWLNG
jgi:phosphoadenosine phosphosulfate reductase